MVTRGSFGSHVRRRARPCRPPPHRPAHRLRPTSAAPSGTGAVDGSWVESVTGKRPRAFEVRPADVLVGKVPILDRLLRNDAVVRLIGLDRGNAAGVSCPHHL